jgi:DNA ligase-1
MHEVFLGMKYEGLMLRDAESLYEFGRTHALLKVKKWFDEEATIVDVTEGKGKMEGKAVFICENKEGQQFRVSMAATMERREEMFQRKNSLIGKELTYTYFEETDDGLPRFPVGIDIRDYE